MLENRVEWGPRIEGLHNSYSVPDVINTIKSRWARWAEYVAHMDRKKIHKQIWYGSLKERDNLKDICLDGMTIWIIIKEMGNI
jgi:hypothetical protein